MDAIVENVNTTAMVIGYPVLAIILILSVWFGARIFRAITKLFDEMKYERWKRRNEERDWDNIEASWVLQLDEYSNEDYRPVQYNNYDTDVFPAIPAQRHNTAELPMLSNFKEN